MSEERPRLHTQIERKASPLGDVYEWYSDERYWVPRSREWYLGYSLFFVIIIAVFAILAQFLFILALIAFVFLWFTQAAVPPEKVKHTINPLGIKTFKSLYKWNTLSHFWFSKKNGIRYLNIDRREDKLNNTPAKRLTILIQSNEDLDLFFILLDFLPYGTRKEVGDNILSQFIYGSYVDIEEYLPEFTEEELNSFEPHTQTTVEPPQETEMEVVGEEIDEPKKPTLKKSTLKKKTSEKSKKKSTKA